MATIYRWALAWKGDSGSPGGNDTISRGQPYNLYSAIEVQGLLIKAHTLCNLSHSIACPARQNVPGLGSPGTGADITVKAVLYFRDPNTLEVLHFQYPSPISADVEDTPGGKRIKQSAVIEIVGYLSVIANITYVPLYGVYMQRQ